MNRVATAGLKGTLVKHSYACLAVKVSSANFVSALVSFHWGFLDILQELTMSPQIVDWGGNAEDVCAASGAGAPKLSVEKINCKGRTTMRRMMSGKMEQARN